MTRTLTLPRAQSRSGAITFGLWRLPPRAAPARTHVRGAARWTAPAVAKLAPPHSERSSAVTSIYGGPWRSSLSMALQLPRKLASHHCAAANASVSSSALVRDHLPAQLGHQLVTSSRHGHYLAVVQYAVAVLSPHSWALSGLRARGGKAVRHAYATIPNP